MSPVAQRAYEFRKAIRAKAGLACDWDEASPEIRDWYFELARKSIEVEKKTPGS